MNSRVHLQNHLLGIRAVGCQVTKWKLAEMVMGFDKGVFFKNLFICLFKEISIWCLLWARLCAQCWGYRSGHAGTVSAQKADILVENTDNTQVGRQVR